MKALVVSLLALEGKGEPIEKYHAADPNLYKATDLKTMRQRLKQLETMLRALQRRPVGSSLKDWGRKDRNAKPDDRLAQLIQPTIGILRIVRGHRLPRRV